MSAFLDEVRRTRQIASHWRAQGCAIVLFVAGFGVVQGAEPAVVEDVHLLVVPSYGSDDPSSWVGSLGHDGAGRLERVVTVSDEVLDRLLTSADGLEVGAGIFVAHIRGDADRLWALRKLLEDARPTIPRTAAGGDPGTFPSVQQTVGEYLARVYQGWFGVSDPTETRFPGIESPWQMVNPWVRRLRIAQRDGDRGEEVRAQISNLEPGLRWAVVTAAFSEQLYSEQEARDALHDCLDLRASAESASLVVSGDPVMNADWNARTLARLRNTFVQLATLPDVPSDRAR